MRSRTRHARDDRRSSETRRRRARRLPIRPPPGRDRVGRWMNWEVFITCPVTGVGDTAGRSEKVPVTTEEIANAAIEAAHAGAAIAHIHVRDPASGAGSREVDLYADVVRRIRE